MLQTSPENGEWLQLEQNKTSFFIKNNKLYDDLLFLIIEEKRQNIDYELETIDEVTTKQQLEY